MFAFIQTLEVMEGEDGADPTLVDGICCKSVNLESETIWNCITVGHKNNAS